jgi:hypothetical protein
VPIPLVLVFLTSAGTVVSEHSHYCLQCATCLDTVDCASNLGSAVNNLPSSQGGPAFECHFGDAVFLTDV